MPCCGIRAAHEQRHRRRQPRLSPFLCLQILSAPPIGHLAFGQLPDWISGLEVAVICAGGVCVASGEPALRAAARRVRRTAQCQRATDSRARCALLLFLQMAPMHSIAANS